MRRLLMALAAVSLMLGILVPAAGAADRSTAAQAVKVEKGQYDSYIVLMRTEPLLASFDQEALGGEAARSARAQLRESHDRALRDAGVNADKKVHDYTNAANGFSALVTHEEAEKLAGQPDVLLVMPDELRQPTTENSPDFLGLTDRGGAWDRGYTGEDVVVGIIDSGIWPEHPSFEDDGTYRPLRRIRLDGSVFSTCDFGNTAHNAADMPFSCNNKLLGARQITPTYRALIGADADEFDSARDDNGHGTHTASTAAGNGGVQAEIFGIDRGEISGIAPRARVIAYKGCGKLGCLTSDTSAAIDQAVLDGVDVINYSIGGGASLLGADDIAYLFAADAGVFVATSAGNSGPGSGTVGGPGSVPWITSVGASTQDRSFQGSASSSDGWEFTGVSITPGTDELPLVDAADAGDELCNIGALDSSVVSGNVVLCKRGAIARAAKSAAVAQAGGAGMILYNASDTQSLNSDNHSVPSVHINNTNGLVIKDYVATSTNPVAQVNGGVATTVTAPVMADFSSRGPNPAAEDIIKPDITAPGVEVLAGASPVHNTADAQGQLFQAIAGTSMSSPHIAGVYALIKQAHRDWSPAAAKSAIMTTAYQDVPKEDGVTPADPFDFGAGHVDPSGRATAPGSIFNPGIVYDAGFNEYLGFLCDAAPEAFGDPEATCAALDAAGIPTDASELNLASIGVAELAGTQTVTRTMTSVANRTTRWRVSVDAPDGYTVEVNPSVITLAPGASASYEVTITNTTAAIGEWEFGSLTWGSRAGTAYSPLAVRATLFSAPASVAGEGESGSASFDVTFGYTGDYAAAGHGLEPAIVTTDAVVQDPDQSFDPDDGFSNGHEFTTSGAAYVRFAIPPDGVADPGAIDLDIFLEDPSGNIVAASTNGGTDEVIDVSLPADGTWTLWVHGWQTAGPSADYDLYTWVVSATPGGNLVVGSAPASATLGATETIDVSWTGATAGEWHLGAVSHSDAGGLIGLTLVEVDNR